MSKSIPPPDAAALYDAALRHLAQYAATEAGLRQVLMRRVERWARTQADQDAAEPAIAAARHAVEAVVARLVQAGTVSDTAFAESRAKSLIRGGQSKRAIQARLIAKGVAPELARDAAVNDAESELAAALVLVRKRRIGAYRATEDPDAAMRLKEMALLARAGFSRQIAEQALAVPVHEAEQRIFALRR